MSCVTFLACAGCPIQTPGVKYGALNCQSPTLNSNTCAFTATNCLYEGVSNNVELDLTTCPYPTSGQLSLLPVLINEGAQVHARPSTQYKCMESVPEPIC